MGGSPGDAGQDPESPGQGIREETVHETVQSYQRQDPGRGRGRPAEGRRQRHRRRRGPAGHPEGQHHPRLPQDRGEHQNHSRSGLYQGRERHPEDRRRHPHGGYRPQRAGAGKGRSPGGDSQRGGHPEHPGDGHHRRQHRPAAPVLVLPQAGEPLLLRPEGRQRLLRHPG